MKRESWLLFICLFTKTHLQNCLGKMFDITDFFVKFVIQINLILIF